MRESDNCCPEKWPLTKGAYLVYFIDYGERHSMTEEGFLRLSDDRHKNLTFHGDTHGKKENIFIGDLGIGDDKVLRFINEEVFGSADNDRY